MSASSATVPDGVTLQDVNREKAKRYAEERPERWLRIFYSEYLTAPFARHQKDFWEWAWQIEPDTKAPAFMAVWPRGHAKSTSFELACVALGARGKKRYVLYVCGTQEQADDHVANIAAMLESGRFGEIYPEMARPLLGKYGNSRGWRRNRLRTASGFTVDAIGLDTAARGAKVEEDRPDVIVFDDIDSEADSELVTERKQRAIQRKIIPAGADKVTVGIGQNLVHENSIVTRLVSGESRFLANRIVSGPVLALEDLRTRDEDGRDVIQSGTPTWAGMDEERCQAMIDEMGLDAFLVECQHQTEILGLWPYRRSYFAHNRFDITDLARRNLVIGRYISWDTAFKTKADSDYSAWVVADVAPDYTLQIVEAGMERFEFPDLLSAAEALAARYDHDFKLMGVIIEDKATGGPLYESLARWSPWLGEFLYPYMPQADKDERTRQAAPWAKRGMISLPFLNPQEAEWLPLLEGQLFNQSSAKKDIRDAFNQLILHLQPELTDGWAARGVSRAGVA